MSDNLLDPATPIPGVPGRAALDFWRRAFSGLVSDATRAVLDPTCWEFYVLPTTQLAKAVDDQAQLGLAGLRALTPPVAFAEPRPTIDALLPVAKPGTGT